MWGMKSIRLLRDDEITAEQAVGNYITDEALDSSRSVQVFTTMLADTDPEPTQVIAMVETVLVNPDRPIIRDYNDFTEEEKLVIAAQVEAAIDWIDWSSLDKFRLFILQNVDKLYFEHEVVDNTLFHSNISVVPNYLN